MYTVCAEALSCQVFSLRSNEPLDVGNLSLGAGSCLLKVLCRQSILSAGNGQRELAQPLQHHYGAAAGVVQRSLSMFMRSAISPRKP